ncbi:C-type lectin 37Db-like isoform X1 [Drosophila eugracilis]|uniref:C-type lectin 37Db-like isoform X1 n=1 Tax=Drosophila eugracilis TaxID=29029 RepID=UPI001BD973E4|nr:C-type lectin 37Db-like isoform X1 [Drosophila eugracilis]
MRFLVVFLLFAFGLQNSLASRQVENDELAKTISDYMSKMRNDLTLKLQNMLDFQAYQLNQLISNHTSLSKENTTETLEDQWNLECSRPPHTTKKCVQLGEKYYYVDFLHTATWLEAESFCRHMGGHLVSLQSDKEWEELKAIFFGQGRSFWVDITVVKEGKYVSETTGKEADYTNFYRYPYNNGASCVYLNNADFKMQKAFCSDEVHFICER